MIRILWFMKILNVSHYWQKIYNYILFHLNESRLRQGLVLIFGTLRFCVCVTFCNWGQRFCICVTYCNWGQRFCICITYCNWGREIGREAVGECSNKKLITCVMRKRLRPSIAKNMIILIKQYSGMDVFSGNPYFAYEIWGCIC